jgi:hypothetical protein
MVVDHKKMARSTYLMTRKDGRKERRGEVSVGARRATGFLTPMERQRREPGMPFILKADTDIRPDETPRYATCVVIAPAVIT